MSHASFAEKSPSSPEGLFSSQEFYDVAIRALLHKGKYSGDSHRLLGTLALYLPESHVATPGAFLAKDYHAWCSREFQFGPSGSGADRAEQRRLLEAGKSIISFTLYKHYDEAYNDTGISFVVCRPEEVREDSTIGALFYSIDGLTPAFGDPSMWPTNGPTIVRWNDPKNKELLSQPDTDIHLQQMYRALAE